MKINEFQKQGDKCLDYGLSEIEYSIMTYSTDLSSSENIDKYVRVSDEEMTINVDISNENEAVTS